MKKELEVEKEVKKKVGIIPIRTAKAIFPIIGKTPLLMDKMSKKVLKEIEDKQTGESRTKGKKTRDIIEEMEVAIHKTSNGTIGFPAAGFKAGIIESTSFVGTKFFPNKKLAKGLKILNAVEGLIPIKFKKKDILIHNVGSNTKHTPQFHDWSCDLEIQFDENNFSASDIAVLINYAGFYSGIGIWSPRCKSGGDFGMYELAIEK